MGHTYGAVNPVEEFLGSPHYTPEELHNALSTLGITHIIFPGTNKWDNKAAQGAIKKGYWKTMKEFNFNSGKVTLYKLSNDRGN